MGRFLHVEGKLATGEWIPQIYLLQKQVSGFVHNSFFVKVGRDLKEAYAGLNYIDSKDIDGEVGLNKVMWNGC